jgi:hypothetical protein
MSDWEREVREHLAMRRFESSMDRRWLTAPVQWLIVILLIGACVTAIFSYL